MTLNGRHILRSIGFNKGLLRINHQLRLVAACNKLGSRSVGQSATEGPFAVTGPRRSSAVDL